MDNPHLNLYFREIVYYNPSVKKNSVCGVFSYEALNVEEAKLGNLYLVGKISNFPPKKHKNFDFLLNLLASAIKREFYSDPQKTATDALESALQSANIYLADFAKKGHKEWIGNIDFTCIVFSQNNIHIGRTGDMLIYLFRGNTVSNIARKFSTQSKKPQPLKTFSNIATGSLEEDDRLIIATPDILNLASVQKIKGLISYPSNEQFYNFLKEKLEKQDTSCSRKGQTGGQGIINFLACLILEARTKPPVVEKERPRIEEVQKITGLDLERILNSKSNKFANIARSKIPPSSKLSKLRPLLKYHIPKYLLIFFLFLLIILSPYIVQKISYDSKIKQVNNLIKRMREAINKGELSLVYQNQAQAQVFLQQANALIANASSLLIQLPEKVKEEPIQTLQLIQEDLDGQKNSINNVVNISQPEEIADLSKNTFSFNPHGILKLEDSLYLYELSSGFIYKINLNDLQNPTLIFLSSKDTFKLGTTRDNSLILLSSPEKIYIYGKNDHYNTYLLKPSVENTLYIKDMANYGDSIYFLNTERLNILKYVPQENSLTGTNWIKTDFNEDLINAQSLAIDGSIYVSRIDGTIIEYLSGRKVKEFKPRLSPEITKGSQIFTTPTMKNLYILDPANNRIIALNKKDSLTIQYVSAEFDSLTDFWVTVDERTVYVLNGLKIYRIDI
jgi:hypothetical protein